MIPAPSGSSVAPTGAASGWWPAALVLLLGLLTAAVGEPAFRTQALDASTVNGGNLVDQACWSWRDGEEVELLADGGLQLRAGARQVYVRCTVELAPSVERLRLTGRFVEWDGYRFRLAPNTRTRAFLRYRDGGGTPLGYDAVSRVSGLIDEVPFDRVGRVPAGARTVDVGLVVPPEAEWRIEQVQLHAVVTRGLYPVALSVTVAAWLALVAAFVHRLITGRDAAQADGRGSLRVWIVGAAVMLALTAVVAGVLLSRGHLQLALRPLAAAISAALPAGETLGHESLTKFGHAVAFMVLTLVLLLGRHRLSASAPQMIALAVALAFATEAAQRHRPGRSADWIDVGIDAIGIAVAVVLWSAGTALRTRFAPGPHR